MSNTMTCTFLTLSLTKPQRISTALSQVVYLNKQTLINTLLEQITLQNKLHVKLSAKHSLLAELLTRTFCKTYIEKHDNRLQCTCTTGPLSILGFLKLQLQKLWHQITERLHHSKFKVNSEVVKINNNWLISSNYLQRLSKLRQQHYKKHWRLTSMITLDSGTWFPQAKPEELHTLCVFKKSSHPTTCVSSVP